MSMCRTCHSEALLFNESENTSVVGQRPNVKRITKRDPLKRGGGRILYTHRQFLNRQRLNAERYVNGLKLLDSTAFGSPPVAPSAAHIKAANSVLHEARTALQSDVAALRRFEASSTPHGIDAFLRLKGKTYRQTQELEKLHAFYYGIFEQRRGPFGALLLPVDRIARDCYQAVWLGLGKARSIPAPPPFAYVEDGKGPATYRRGVRLSVLGRRQNPFPLVKIPKHRLQNPWTLGAIPHEVAHNLQNDLCMWSVVPRTIRRIMADRLDPTAIDIWARWHKESYADLAGVLLIGPAYIESLIDVVGKTRRQTAMFNPSGVHPTPLLRVPLNCALLRRIGFVEEADAFENTWHRLYPKALRRKLPAAFRDTFNEGARLLVDAICFQPANAYGGKRLVDVIRFSHKDNVFVQEAAERLISGENTGVLPERYLIAAARLAIGFPQADPVVITKNFYDTLGRP